MKKLLPALGLFTTFCAQAQLGYVTNGGFENWTSTTIYENPDSWGTSNYAEGTGTESVFKSTDAAHLTYSCLLQNTVTAAGDTAFAYVYMGTIGPGGPDAGIPYTAACNQLNFSGKYDIAAGDTGRILVIKYMGGSIVSQDIFSFTGVQSSWTPVTLPINAALQDSIFIGFISGDAFGGGTPNPNSWGMVDNVSLSHTIAGPGPALPNFSFENWTAVSYSDPDSWASFNSFLAPYGATIVNQTTDASAGTYAAEVVTQVFFGDTLQGGMYYGTINATGDLIPHPYTAMPTTLSGMYKFAASGTDSAQAAVIFLNMGTPVGYNEIMLPPAGSYTPFSMPTFLGSAPDSVVIVFYSGLNPGSVLKVDEVQFSGGTVGVTTLNKLPELILYPNPVRDVLTVNLNNRVEDLTLSVYDAQGRLMETRTIYASGTDNVLIETSGWSNGVYRVSLQNDHSKITRAFSVIH